MVTDKEIPSRVPTFVIRKSFKELVIPTKAEGFSKVFKINFKPNFDSDVNEQLYYMYLMEK
jgi:hypothetical protein